MAGFTTYKTVAGDSWSGISYKAYGDVSYIKTITDANPDAMLTPLLTAGLILQIPILDAVPNSVNTDLLPPWKQ